ncbi:MAG: transcription termination/antitermination protein NusG [Pirellulales bacterium]
MIDDPHNSSQLSDEAALARHAVVPPAEPPRDPADAPHGEAAPQQAPPDAPAHDPDESHHEEFIAEEAGADDEAGVELIEEEEVEPRGPIEETPVSDEPPKMNWYILKVQSNREESIRESLQRRVKVAGLERYFGEIIVPTEMVSEFKGGKKRVIKRKLYPGYLMAHMEINDETWFLVRETPGIGDFTGSAGKPTAMQPHEVSKIVAKQEEKSDEAPKLKINFNVGDRVKINEGTFDNFEGEVDSIDEASGRVTVMINIFGRSTPVELEYWQIEAI